MELSLELPGDADTDRWGDVRRGRHYQATFTEHSTQLLTFVKETNTLLHVPTHENTLKAHRGDGAHE